MILLYDKSYTGLEGLLEGLFQYTSLYTVYEWPLIRISTYTILRSTIHVIKH